MSTKPSVLPQSVEELERVFNRFDANGDGKICTGELDGVLRALGSETSQEELKQMMTEIDADGDGFIDLKEFVEFHRRSDGEDQDEMKELRCAFDLYDKDRDGLISATELHMVLKSLGEGCTVHDCGRMISSFDSDGDGNVNFEEFKKMMTVTRGASSE